MIEFEKLPPINPSPISVAVPVFNQAQTIADEVRAWRTTLTELNVGHELLIVDDGSPDGTNEIVRDLQPTYPELALLTHSQRRGFGAALRTALAAAKYPLFAYAAGGQSYRPSDLLPMLKWIDDCHLVAGYRVAAAGHREFQSSWWRRRLAKTCFGVLMRDLGCFFVLARRSIFERVPIQSNSTFAHIELLAKANFQSCLMTECPVTVDRQIADFNPWENDRLLVRAEMLKVFRNPEFGNTENEMQRGRDGVVTTPLQ